MNKQSQNVNEEISNAKQSVKIGYIRYVSEYSFVEKGKKYLNCNFDNIDLYHLSVAISIV